tara:strand:+ start:330 stop:902 length:573 start_codon:yes stop_codon:yes gene_type:complete
MIQFYKPNSKNTGSACSFWSNYDGSIMCSLIKQASWNDKTKKGSFAKNKDNPSKRVIVKLNPTEVGGLIDSIETNREFANYHNSQNQTLQIKFSPYMRNGDQIGFSFSVYKQDKEDSANKASYVIGFTFPEARYLKEFLSYVLQKIFEKEHEAHLKKQKEKIKDIMKEKRAEASNADRSPKEEQEGEDIW